MASQERFHDTPREERALVTIQNTFHQPGALSGSPSVRRLPDGLLGAGSPVRLESPGLDSVPDPGQGSNMDYQTPLTDFLQLDGNPSTPDRHSTPRPETPLGAPFGSENVTTEASGP